MGSVRVFKLVKNTSAHKIFKTLNSIPPIELSSDSLVAKASVLQAEDRRFESFSEYHILASVVQLAEHTTDNRSIGVRVSSEAFYYGGCISIS